MPRSGRPPQYDGTVTARILAALDDPPPEGYVSWNGRLLAEALGDVSARQVWRVLAERRISLQRRQSWCISTDPEFAQRKARTANKEKLRAIIASVFASDSLEHWMAKMKKANIPVGYLRTV